MLKSAMAGVALGAFAFLGTAEASIVTVSYSGQITMGADAYNEFGTVANPPSAGVDLTGQFLTLTYVFDTSKGVYSNMGGSQEVIGGSSFLGQSPAVSFAVTINNKTLSFSGESFGLISATTDTGNNQNLLSQGAAYDPDGYTFASTALTAPLGSIPGSITSSFAMALGGVGEPTASGLFGIFDVDTPEGRGITGSFDARSIAISVVPLPSALPLFGLALVGLGGAAALRKRHSLRASR